jgi:hypothetical protein
MITRKGIYQKIKLYALFSIILIVPSITLVNGENYQLISYIGDEPTIDGFIDESERDATGKPVSTLLPFDTWYVGGGDGLPREVEIGTFHTSNSKLYINTRIEYDCIKEGNITYIFRKKGTDDDFDLKELTSATNNSIDSYRLQNDWQHHVDIDFGGTENSEGKCHLTENSLTFELLIPYNSNDTIGHDLNVTLNDEIEFKFILRIMYLNDSQEEWNWYAWPTEELWSIVFTNSSAVPLSFIGLITGIFLLPIIQLTRKRRK